MLDFILLICIVVLVILCAGEPDLLDAITNYVELKGTCK